MKRYRLMNKDKTLIVFEEPDVFGEYKILDYDNSLKSIMPPVFTSNINADNLGTFLDNRVISVNRTHMKIVFEELDLKTNFEQILYCRGLSLTDSFWILDEQTPLNWKHCNLYDNKFDEALGYMAFTGIPSDVSRDLNTPELTTVGVLPKYWERSSNKIRLIKGGSKFEPISEVCASVVADILRLDTIHYSYNILKDKPVSICELFTSENTGLLTANEFKYITQTEYKRTKITEYMQLMKDYNIDIHKLKRLVFFDDLIKNNDRHLNNWGFLVCNDTRKILNFSPIWDSGEGLIAKTDINKNPLTYAGGGLFPSFGIKYQGLRLFYYGEKELQDLERLQSYIDNGTLKSLFFERGISKTENNKLDLICEILKVRIKIIKDDLTKKQINPSTIFT